MTSTTRLIPEDLLFLGICDLSGLVRGKSVPASEMNSLLHRGVGYTPANLCLSALGTIGATPFGTLGDIVLMPDLSTEVNVLADDGPPEHFCLANIYTKEGTRWDYCPRYFLEHALTRLYKVTGCTLLAGFEQEFVYTGAAAQPPRPYTLTAFRQQAGFGATFLSALRSAGVVPESFLAEFGPRQFEVTVRPSSGIRAADEAVLVRELARFVALRHGHRAIFAPMLEPDGTGNGTHIHISLHQDDGTAALPAPDRPYGLSKLGEHFAAGLLHHLPALTAVTAPSVSSYFRLTPDRWAPTCANIAVQDRAASLRICPGSPKSFNLEYRVADATANPYLALGALIHAGVDGIEQAWTLPAPVAKPFGSMTDDERREAGMHPLPASLDGALLQLENTPEAPAWFGRDLLELYLNFKKQECQALAGVDPQAVCNRYAAIH